MVLIEQGGILMWPLLALSVATLEILIDCGIAFSTFRLIDAVTERTLLAAARNGDVAAAFAVHGIDMRLPKSSAARACTGRPLEIVLTAGGELHHGGKTITQRDLGFLIRHNANGEDRNRQILLIPDREASVGAFMQTVNTIRDNGGDRLVVAAEPSPRGGDSR